MSPHISIGGKNHAVHNITWRFSFKTITPGSQCAISMVGGEGVGKNATLETPFGVIGPREQATGIVTGEDVLVELNSADLSSIVIITTSAVDLNDPDKKVEYVVDTIQDIPIIEWSELTDKLLTEESGTVKTRWFIPEYADNGETGVGEHEIKIEIVDCSIPEMKRYVEILDKFSDTTNNHGHFNFRYRVNQDCPAKAFKFKIKLTDLDSFIDKQNNLTITSGEIKYIQFKPVGYNTVPLDVPKLPDNPLQFLNPFPHDLFGFPYSKQQISQSDNFDWHEEVSNGYDFDQSLINGIIFGDYSDDNSFTKIGAQTLIGLIPIVGQIADARDTIHAIYEVWVSGGSEGKLNLVFNLVAWVPLAGDVVKGILKPVVNSGEAAINIAKHADSPEIVEGISRFTNLNPQKVNVKVLTNSAKCINNLEEYFNFLRHARASGKIIDEAGQLEKNIQLYMNSYKRLGGELRGYRYEFARLRKHVNDPNVREVILFDGLKEAGDVAGEARKIQVDMAVKLQRPMRVEHIEFDFVVEELKNRRYLSATGAMRDQVDRLSAFQKNYKENSIGVIINAGGTASGPLKKYANDQGIIILERGQELTKEEIFSQLEELFNLPRP